MEKEFPNRKNIRLEGYNYSNAGAYFITICVKNGRKILGNIDNNFVSLSDTGLIGERNLLEISEHIHGVRINKYVIMPNHVHLILEISKNVGTRYIASVENNILINNEARTPYMASLQERSKQTVSKTIQQYKSSVTRDTRIAGLWQPRFHDHIIRNEGEYRRIWQYIDENPAKWAEDEYFNIDNL